MSRRKAPSLIEIRTADGLVVVIENPPETLLREVFTVIGSHTRPDAAKRAPRRFTRAGDDPVTDEAGRAFHEASTAIRGQEPVQ